MKINIPIIVTIEIPDTAEEVIVKPEPLEYTNHYDKVWQIRASVMKKANEQVANMLSQILQKKLCTINELAKDVGVSSWVITQCLKGENVSPKSHKKLQKFLDDFHGNNNMPPD